MIEENKYCIGVMKQHFNKELVMNNEDNEVRDYCHISAKYRGSSYRDCNIKSQNSYHI